VATRSDKAPVTLETGVPVEGSLQGGETVTFLVRADRDEFIRADVDQRGIDVSVQVVAPGGMVVYEVDSPNGEYGPEPIVMIAEAAGTYTVIARPLDAAAPEGNYSAILRERRPPSGGATFDCVSAWKALIRGDALRVQATPESLRTAVLAYTEALVQFGILRQATDIDDARGEAEAHFGLGAAQEALGERAKALDSYQSNTGGAVASYLEALPLLHASASKAVEASTLVNLGVATMTTGDPGDAADRFASALPYFRSVRDVESEATTLTYLGIAYNAIGELQKALDAMNEALPLRRAIAARTGDSRGVASTLSSIGTTYSLLGDHERALAHHETALPLQRAAGDQAGIAATLSYIGLARSHLGETTKAVAAFEEALAIREARNDTRGTANVLLNLGAVAQASGDLRGAMARFERALELWRLASDHSGEAATLSSLAFARALSGENEKAIAMLDDALALTGPTGDTRTEASILGARARVLERTGRLADARVDLERALDIFERSRSTVVSQELRATFFASRSEYYAAYINVLMKLHDSAPSGGYDALALRASERARARGLVELLAEARVDLRRDAPSALVARKRTLERGLDERAGELARLRLARAGESQVAAAQRSVDTSLEEIERVETEIRRASPRFAALEYPRPLSLDEIRRRVLDRDTALLEYALGSETSYLWVVTLDRLATFRLPPRSEIGDVARALVELLNERNRAVADESAEQRRTRWSRADADYWDTAELLSDMILAPAARLLGSKRLLVSADGPLHVVPFAALPAPSARNATDRRRPLVADHEIAYIASATALAELRAETSTRPRSTRTLVAFGDPVFGIKDDRIAPESSRGVASESRIANLPRLPETASEARGIVALVPPGQATLLLGFEANRGAATSQDLGNYRLVHFATHGIVDSQQPQLSGLVLSLVDAKGTPQDGFLRAYDVYGLTLSADAVVLSACQTGLGKEMRGEGIVGFTRGFMYAGAARVVVTLWSVNDSATRDLMLRFYEAILRDGASPSAALRAAQLAVRAGSGREAPYYWAAFTVHGEYR
jgi:CHAT domain-containing protein/Tfp pilus assembly protein PilF